jgi:hypothetical protein
VVVADDAKAGRFVVVRDGRIAPREGRHTQVP